MNKQGLQLGFTDYVGMVWRRRKTALLLAGPFACITFVAFNFVPRHYTARTVFERHGDTIARRTEKTVPESFTNLKPMLMTDLTDGEAVRRALRKLGHLDRFDRDWAGALTGDGEAEAARMTRTVQKGLRPMWVVKSANVDRVALSLTSTDPVLAYTVPNQLVRDYIDATHKRLVEQLGQSLKFLSERIDLAKATAAEVRTQRHAFLAKHPDTMPENPQILTERLRQIDTEMETLQQQQKFAADRLAELQPTVEAGGAFRGGGGKANPAYVAVARKIVDLEKQIAHLRDDYRMTEKHPRLVKLSKALAAQQAELAGIPPRLAGPRVVNPAVAQARIELSRFDRLIARKQELRERYQIAQANFVPVAREYQCLTDRIEQAEAEVGMWRHNRAEVQMALDAERNGSRTHMGVVKPAALVTRPSWPALWHVFGLALGGGVIFGITVVILMTRLSRSFASPEDARESLGLPLLGVVGPILSPTARRLRALRRYLLIPAMTCILVAITVVAAATVVMSTNYPVKYAQIVQQVTPVARSAWHGMRNLLGAI